MCKAIIAGASILKTGIIEESNSYGVRYRWLHDTAGIYSVKSGYEHLTGIAPDAQFKWKIIWELKCSQKLRVLLWRMVKDRLPTAINLHRRKIIESGECNICGATEEDISHIFMECKAAKILWRELGLSSTNLMSPAAGIGTIAPVGVARYCSAEINTAQCHCVCPEIQPVSTNNLEQLPVNLQQFHSLISRRNTAPTNRFTEQQRKLHRAQHQCNFRRWLEANLKVKNRIYGLEWRTVFAAAVSVLWTRRNETLFDSVTGVPRLEGLKRDTIKLASEYVAAWGVECDGGIIKSSKSELIKWSKPKDKIKLNVDGSCDLMRRKAGIGGLLRGMDGEYIAGFSGACVVESPLHSETLALHYGLKWALSRGISELHVETDSRELHALVKGGGSSKGWNCHVSRDCNEILKRYPGIELRSVYREANLCADLLAKNGADRSEGPSIFEDPPDFLWDTITSDRSGIAFPRLVIDSQ